MRNCIGTSHPMSLHIALLLRERKGNEKQVPDERTLLGIIIDILLSFRFDFIALRVVGKDLIVTFFACV